MWQVYSVGGREDLSKMLIFTSKIKKKNWTEDNFKKKNHFTSGDSDSEKENFGR